MLINHFKEALVGVFLKELEHVWEDVSENVLFADVVDLIVGLVVRTYRDV